MPINDYGIRFTENKYATKNEVAKELKMSMVDAIWSPILKYRTTYNHYLPLRSIERSPLSICLCQTVQGNINSLDTKILNLKKVINDLENKEKVYQANNFEKCLKNYQSRKDIHASDSYIHELVNGFSRSFISEEQQIVNYFNALKCIQEKYDYDLNQSVITELYNKLTNDANNPNVFRHNNSTFSDTRILIDHIYSSAPYENVIPMMELLYDFVLTCDLPTAVKATIAYYYVNYIKPFPNFNDEMAILVFKFVLAHEQLGPIAAYLPFEAFFDDKKVEQTKACNEVQKTNDITYFVVYANSGLSFRIQELTDEAFNVSRLVVKEQFYQTDEVSVEPPHFEEPKVNIPPIVEEEPKTETFYIEEESIMEEIPVPEAHVEEPKQEIKEEEPEQRLFDNPQIERDIPLPFMEEVKPEPAPEPIKEEKPVVIEKPKPVEKPRPVIERITEPVNDQPVVEHIAVSYIPPVLDEKEAQRLENHLLECDPLLKKGQAKFYSRHCTIGKLYTIAQYKKFNGCVYETARTSMDSLVELGYYKKQQIKNKFVYTPLERK